MQRNTLSLKFIAAMVLALGLTQLSGANELRKTFRGGTVQAYLESATAKFYISSDLVGTAVVRECVDCDPVRLRVNPGRVVSNADAPNAPIAWTADFSIGQRKIDVIYHATTKVIDRVVVYTE